MISVSWEQLAKWLVGGWMFALSWLAKHLWGEISGKASKSELAEILKRMEERYEEARDSREDIKDTLDKTVTLVHETSKAVARIEGRLGGGP